MLDHTRTRLLRRCRVAVLTSVPTLALVAALVPAGPVSAATRPQPPVSPFLSSTDTTSPQFCAQGAVVSRSRTPILGVSSGAPAVNTGRPDLAATFQVAPVGQPTLATGTVPFRGSLASYRVPAGVLAEGQYRFRVRAVDGGSASAWLPWCTFTVSTVDVPEPGTPTGLRLSEHDYAGFQYCAAGSTPAVAEGTGPTFAASPASVALPPNVVGRFEITRPGREPITLTGRLYGVRVAAGSLDAGEHQFRVRAEDGDAVSAWSPWCTFVVR